MNDVTKTESSVESSNKLPQVGANTATEAIPNAVTGTQNNNEELTPKQQNFVDSMFLKAEQRGTTGIPFIDILIANKIADNTKLDPSNTQKNIIKVYGQEIDAAKYSYNRNLATYGIRNEQLARQGLMNSGLSDYEKNAAFAELQKSRMTSFENAMNRLDTYKSEMYNLIADEQIKKDSELQGYVNTLINAGLTGESAKMLLAAYGVDPDIAQRIVETTDPVVNQQKTDNVRSTLRENGLYGDKAVKYAMQMGLDETTAKSLGAEMDELFAEDIATNNEILAMTYQQLRDQGLTDYQIKMKFLTSVENDGYGLTLSDFKTAKEANMAGTTTGADGSTESYTEPNVKNIYEALDGDPNMAATLAQNWGISAEEWQAAMDDKNDDVTVESLILRGADAKYHNDRTARSNVYLQTTLRQIKDYSETGDLSLLAELQSFLDTNFAAFTAEDLSKVRTAISEAVNVTGARFNRTVRARANASTIDESKVYINLGDYGSTVTVEVEGVGDSGYYSNVRFTNIGNGVEVGVYNDGKTETLVFKCLDNITKTTRCFKYSGKVSATGTEKKAQAGYLYNFLVNKYR